MADTPSKSVRKTEYTSGAINGSILSGVGEVTNEVPAALSPGLLKAANQLESIQKRLTDFQKYIISEEKLERIQMV